MVVRRLAWIWAIGALVGITPIQAQTVTLDTLSLFGLPGVRVAVDFTGAEPHGITGDTLQSEIETAVRAAGIPVLTEDEWQVTIGNPMLRLHVNLVRPSEHFYLFSLELEVLQLAVLARDSTIPSFGGTWAAGDVVGTVPADRLGSLRQHVHGMVGQFVAAHATANRVRHRWIRASRRHAPMLTGQRIGCPEGDQTCSNRDRTV